MTPKDIAYEILSTLNFVIVDDPEYQLKRFKSQCRVDGVMFGSELRVAYIGIAQKDTNITPKIQRELINRLIDIIGKHFENKDDSSYGAISP